MSSYRGKRLLDLMLAVPTLIILSPLMGMIWVVVRWKMGTPVVFKQERPGLNGRPFTMYKFRTMTNERDANGNLLPDEQRLILTGKILRVFSLDELPELFNVVKGNMSLVGPRPLLMRYLPRYNEHQQRRHDVLPGITGWAQINGRNTISWEEKFDLDVWYVEHASLWLDIKILLLTVWKVIRREGVSSETHATMEEFFGSD
ncbi:MAG: sugar transferase [Chloroflexi bacterium]|nr:sugar transferase [Chloroflexota bacterium]